MRVIRASEQKRMPWKNGGGVTNEVLVSPREGRFLYRVSVADVASDGPFSRFEGYDRHIMLIGAPSATSGMTLDCGAHGRIALARFEPKTFSGDWDVTGTLTNGPVRDLNLIVDRSRARASLRVSDVEGVTTFAPEGTCILHVLAGALADADVGDTIVAIDGEITVTGTAKLARMNIVET